MSYVRPNVMRTLCDDRICVDGRINFMDEPPVTIQLDTGNTTADAREVDFSIIGLCIVQGLMVYCHIDEIRTVYKKKMNIIIILGFR